MFFEGQRVEVRLSAKLIRDERILKTPLSLMVSYFPMRLGVAWASRMTPGVMTMGLDLTFYDTSLPKGINVFYLDYPTSYISNQRHKLLPPPHFLLATLGTYCSSRASLLLHGRSCSTTHAILVPEPGVIPCIGRQIPNDWTIRKVPIVLFLHRLREKILEPLLSGLSLVYIKNNMVNEEQLEQSLAHSKCYMSIYSYYHLV